MLNKVEFSDLYKFITSVGLIFIASTFIFPWLFMKNELGIELSTEEYNSLIAKSKDLANNRIKLNLTIVKLIPWISSGFFIVGITMVFIGLKNWKKKQDIVDETEDLRLAELRNKVESMSPKEAKRKAEIEVLEEIEATVNSTIELNQPEKNKKPNKEKQEILTEKLINMETLFFKKIEEFNSFNYEVKQNVKLVRDFGVDIFLQAFNKKTHRDIMIEIKFLQSNLNMKLIRDSYNRFFLTHSHYGMQTKRNAMMEFIIVYKDDIASPEEINRFKLACDALQKEINYPSFRMYVMNESEAKNFDIQKIVI